MTGTFWALMPAFVAIGLALITKEVYSSLFIGIILGGIFFAVDAASGFTGFVQHVFNDGLIAQVSDPYNAGILVFLVLLGTMVALMNKAGGSAAFGEWAKTHIKTKIGAQIATVILGILIFIDDYFNCLTVGSVMKPVTDKHKVSREKLAYLIDSTAAPVCIIAPISSWAAAVSGFVTEGENGIALFCKAIPYNYYALFTLIMVIAMILLKVEFGPMKKYEQLVEHATAKYQDKYNDLQDEMGAMENRQSKKGKVIDLVIPIIVLIISCTLGMIYSGNFFTKMVEDEAGVMVANGTYLNFIEAFASSDASVGLVLGSFAAFIFTVIFYLIRKIITFESSMNCIVEGFKSMVPAILILTLAWTLKGMTDSLNAKEFVAGLVSESASSFKNFLPAIIFIIAAGLAFATGTSWGTFGILIPICISVFPEATDPLRVISISACMAGAVCGDHISPISDTTIMASAGAQCKHVDHVSSQIPYALVCAGVSFITFIVAGFVNNPIVSFLIGLIILAGALVSLKYITTKESD